MTHEVRKSEPQNPPFTFPDRVRLVPGQIWRGQQMLPRCAVADDNGDMVKDENGDTIFMGYCGPTSLGKPCTHIYIVAHDTPTHVHPASKYIYQRYGAKP